MRTCTIHHGGQFMKMDATGGITRNGVHHGKAWYITGAVRRNNFGAVVEHFTLADIFRGGIQWFHKNGKQRVHVCDVDHGTQREWTLPMHSITPDA